MDDKQILEAFANNDLMLEAVHKFLRKQFSGDKLDTSMNNEILGQKTRARLEGLAKVEGAFRELRTLKTIKNDKQGINPAR